jgi:hypothetical protein
MSQNWKPVIRAFPIQKGLEHGLSLTGSHNQTASKRISSTPIVVDHGKFFQGLGADRQPRPLR